MGMLDTVLRNHCHEIYGIVAVQHLELYFRGQGTKILLLYALLAVSNPALAGTITHPNPPDPLLDGGAASICAAGAEYVPGQDVNGRPVAPADPDAGPVPVPPSIAMPLPQRGHHGDSPYVSLDGKKLDRLGN